MKLIIYKNPVISGMLLNLCAMFFCIYGITHKITLLFIMPVPVGILNRKIIDNEINMNNKKKTLILVSFIVMICVILIYNSDSSC